MRWEFHPEALEEYREATLYYADRDYYRLVSRGIQELCAAANVMPYVLDAAVFASFDNGRWNSANMEDWGYEGA